MQDQTRQMLEKCLEGWEPNVLITGIECYGGSEWEIPAMKVEVKGLVLYVTATDMLETMRLELSSDWKIYFDDDELSFCSGFSSLMLGQIKVRDLTLEEGVQYKAATFDSQLSEEGFYCRSDFSSLIITTDND